MSDTTTTAGLPSNVTLPAGLGIVFFNENNRAGAILRIDGADTRIYGSWNEAVVNLAGDDGALMLERVNPSSEKHPVARGTLMLKGTVKRIVGFRAKLEDGTTVLGLSEAMAKTPVVSCPW
jgi:hypothetical protein